MWSCFLWSHQVGLDPTLLLPQDSTAAVQYWEVRTYYTSEKRCRIVVRRLCQKTAMLPSPSRRTIGSVLYVRFELHGHDVMWLNRTSLVEILHWKKRRWKIDVFDSSLPYGHHIRLVDDSSCWRHRYELAAMKFPLWLVYIEPSRCLVMSIFDARRVIWCHWFLMALSNPDLFPGGVCVIVWSILSLHFDLGNSRRLFYCRLSVDLDVYHVAQNSSLVLSMSWDGEREC